MCRSRRAGCWDGAKVRCADQNNLHKAPIKNGFAQADKYFASVHLSPFWLVHWLQRQRIQYARKILDGLAGEQLGALGLRQAIGTDVAGGVLAEQY